MIEITRTFTGWKLDVKVVRRPITIEMRKEGFASPEAALLYLADAVSKVDLAGMGRHIQQAIDILPGDTAACLVGITLSMYVQDGGTNA